MSHKRKKDQSPLHDATPIPNKLYFTISEVSDLCSVKAYVLRYWEQEFAQLAPLKRKGNRRFYQQQDIVLIRRIKKLLYQDGFTIEGARQKLEQNSEPNCKNEKDNEKNDVLIKKMIAELESLLQNLQLELA